MATGDINDNVDQYRTQQRQLASAEQSSSTSSEPARRPRPAPARPASRRWPKRPADQAQLDQLQQQLNQDIEAAAVGGPAAGGRRPRPRPQAARPRRRPRPPVKQRPRQPRMAPGRRRPDAGAGPQGLPGQRRAWSRVVPRHRHRPAHPPRPRRRPRPPAGSGGAGGVWLQLRECESGDNYAENTGNGFYGAYQFSRRPGPVWAIPAGRIWHPPDPGSGRHAAPGRGRLGAVAGLLGRPGPALRPGPAAWHHSSPQSVAERPSTRRPGPPTAPAAPCRPGWPAPAGGRAARRRSGAGTGSAGRSCGRRPGRTARCGGSAEGRRCAGAPGPG